MKLIKSSDGQYYDAAKHFHCWSVHKLTPGTESKRLNVAFSHFLPNGGTEMASSPLERIYYVLAGCMKIKGKAEEFVLNPGDLLYIGPGEDREVSVVGTQPASILVVMCKVD
jgi:mannose-6-phosphate isomerase-like protein (cupin superfamily)